jgi:hypothetical protein
MPDLPVKFLSSQLILNSMQTAEQIERLKFPIGPFVAPAQITSEELERLIKIVEDAPGKYRAIASGLSKNDLNKTYREGSWNVRQLFHHVADMEMLHFFRMKKALTENDYKEITLVSMDGWAKTDDGLYSDIEDSLNMFESITRRHVKLMRSLTQEQQQVAYYHPVRKVMLDQKQAIAMSAWHVRHHIEHLKIALS